MSRAEITSIKTITPITIDSEVSKNNNKLSSAVVISTALTANEKQYFEENEESSLCAT